MAATNQPQGISMSRPATSHQQHVHLTNGIKRNPGPFDEGSYESPSFVSLPSNDSNAWYYPSHGHSSEGEGDDSNYSTVMGNWGRKSQKHARWIRKGKMIAWGPGIEDWDAEERARKRIKMMLPTPPDQDEPVVLPHLRSPSPPSMAPYPSPNTQHSTYTSFVLDKSTTHTYRSHLLDEMEQVTNNLIEGETVLRRALGRLWQAVNEDPPKSPAADQAVVPKQEDEGDATEKSQTDQRAVRAPDLTPAIHKIFLSSYPEQPSSPMFDPSQFTLPDQPLENLEKSMAALRELQDDGREYVERLEEIREGLGFARTQRNGVWNLVRERALKELQDAAYASAL